MWTMWKITKHLMHTSLGRRTSPTTPVPTFSEHCWRFRRQQVSLTASTLHLPARGLRGLVAARPPHAALPWGRPTARRASAPHCPPCAGKARASSSTAQHRLRMPLPGLGLRRVREWRGGTDGMKGGASVSPSPSPSPATAPSPAPSPATAPSITLSPSSPASITCVSASRLEPSPRCNWSRSQSCRESSSACFSCSVGSR